MNDGSLAQSVLEEIADKNLGAGNEHKDVYRIGDLAREFEVSLRTLRFYEDKGLISPQRTGSTRLYSNEDRTRLKVILLAKNVGFSLSDIQELLAMYDAQNSDVARIQAKFRAQLDTLVRQKADIERSIGDLHNAIGILQTK
ncbi:MAG: MerR family DNA-binding transcriptional regulator [Pseudomonadota bacterium]